MNATIQRLESDASDAMQAYFKYGNDTDAINASLWYRQAHHMRIGRPLSKAQYRSILQNRRRLLTQMTKREPAKLFLVPIRGGRSVSQVATP